MSLEIGPMRFQPHQRVEHLPDAPPAAARAEVDAAWRRVAELAAQNRELHFSKDPQSGRVIIEVRTLAGEVLRKIPPAKALAVMGGEEL